MGKRIGIIGGGISGLTLAYDLHKAGIECSVFEASYRVGGKIRTLNPDNFTLEVGPDCFHCGRPHALELAEELGLGDSLLAPEESRFCLYIDGSLQLVPAGLVSFTSMNLENLEKAAFLSEEAKEAVRNEPSVPAGTADDESIAGFFRRRFGEEFSKTIAETLLAGTHGGFADQLSMKALFPALFSLERTRGYLTGTAPQVTNGNKRPAFLSFREGMESFTRALAAKLPSALVHRNALVEKLERSGSKWRINGEEFDAAAVTVPSHHAVSIIQPVSASLASLLGKIEFASSVIVTLETSRLPDDALPGTGFLVPAGQGAGITGATFTSRKWSGRCSEEHDLIRVFIPRASDNPYGPASKGRIAAAATEALESILGQPVRPERSTVQIWNRALPQYRLGHHELVDEIDAEAAALGGIHFTGTAYRGVGIPDCIRQARTLAQKLS